METWVKRNPNSTNQHKRNKIFLGTKPSTCANSILIGSAWLAPARHAAVPAWLRMTKPNNSTTLLSLHILLRSFTAPSWAEGQEGINLPEKGLTQEHRSTGSDRFAQTFETPLRHTATPAHSSSSLAAYHLNRCSPSPSCTGVWHSLICT